MSEEIIVVLGSYAAFTPAQLNVARNKLCATRNLLRATSIMLRRSWHGRRHAASASECRGCGVVSWSLTTTPSIVWLVTRWMSIYTELEVALTCLEHFERGKRSPSTLNVQSQVVAVGPLFDVYDFILTGTRILSGHGQISVIRILENVVPCTKRK